MLLEGLSKQEAIIDFHSIAIQNLLVISGNDPMLTFNLFQTNWKLYQNQYTSEKQVNPWI